MDTYEQYALLCGKIEEFEAQKEELKAVLIADMTKRGKLTEDHALGKYTIAKLKRWTYPAKIVKLESAAKAEISAITDDLKAEKAKAESNGEATYEEQDSFRFTPIKL